MIEWHQWKLVIIAKFNNAKFIVLKDSGMGILQWT